MRLKYQGLDLQTYYAYTNNNEEKMREFMKEGAEKKVKTDLVLESIINAENVEANDEECKEKASEIAKQYGGDDIEKMADLLMKAQGAMIKHDIKVEKTIEMLVKESNIA